MTVNFQQHERELLAAFDKVATSKTCDDWVIFEYEGNSNVLRVGEQGDYGVDEFASSFNAGRLQYGVAAVKSQAISQPKIVLVHWQGESVPATRLASTTSHVNDVKRFLKGVHVVLYARSELDVDSATITSAVEKLPGMKDNKAEASYAQPAPVSSVYTPVKPNRDAGLAARDDFWKQEKEREQAEQREQREQEQRRRDDVLARTPSPAKAPSPVPVQPAPVAPPPAAAPSEPTQRIAANRRAMFEQMSAGAPPPMPKPAAKTSKWTVNGAGSFNGKAPSVIEPVKSTPPAPVASQPARFPAPAPAPPAPTPAPIPTPVAPPPAPSAPPAMVPPPAPAAVSSYYEEPPMEEIAPPPVPQYEEPPCVDVVGEGLRAVALWDYQAEDASEISFDPDEVISEIDQVDAGWWRGRAPNGHVGLFPANYVTLLQ